MMLTIVLLAAASIQDAPASDATHPIPQRFSILVQDCPAATTGPDDVVVCGRNREQGWSHSLTPRDEPPKGPQPSNPNLDGRGAMAAERPVCAALQGGCQVGVDMFGAGTAAIRLVQKVVAPDSCCEEPGEATSPLKLVGDAVGGIKKAFARKPDRSKRISIDLAAPPSPGRLLP